jgi:hypothetical protein
MGIEHIRATAIVILNIVILSWGGGRGYNSLRHSQVINMVLLTIGFVSMDVICYGFELH